jgi:hypothetical protein
MLQEFDVLQGKLQALKRDSLRPSVSGTGGPPVQRPKQQPTPSSTRPPEAAAARATQPAALHRSAEPITTRPLQHATAALPPRQQQAPQPAAKPQQQQQQQLAQQQASPASSQGGPADGYAPGSHAATAAAAPGAGGGVGVGGLAARLESLKRESVRPSLVGAQGVQFETVGQIDTQGLSRLAMQLFDDDQFKQLCEKGMNAQLTRSKDGATGA